MDSIFEPTGLNILMLSLVPVNLRFIDVLTHICEAVWDDELSVAAPSTQSLDIFNPGL